MSAADMLGKMRTRAAVEPLIEAIFDEDFAVQMEAVKALGNIGDAKALIPLRDLINNGPHETEEDLLLTKNAIKAIQLIRDKQ